MLLHYLTIKSISFTLNAYKNGSDITMLVQFVELRLNQNKKSNLEKDQIQLNKTENPMINADNIYTIKLKVKFLNLIMLIKSIKKQVRDKCITNHNSQ